MPFPTTRTLQDSEQAVRTISSQLWIMLDQLALCRAQIAAGSIDSGMISNTWAVVTATRVTVLNLITLIGATNLVAAYVRKYPSLAGVDLATQWTTAQSAIDKFGTDFLAAMPKDASGHPALQAVGSDNQFTTFSTAVPAGTKTLLLADIDAVRAAFVD